MAIELLILSGRRLGERLAFTQDAILLGGEGDCDVCFQVRYHPRARGKRACLEAGEYGWRLRNDGDGLWFVNQAVVPSSSACPVRPGDIIRISEFGPDLRFAVLEAAVG
jgi:hypothetical protein